MKNKLDISKDLKMPNNAVTEKLAWLGTTGGGKTYAASHFAEQCWYIGAQFVVLDPVGVWYGLRLAKDGKKPSKINIPIFGGLHGDVPLEPTGGELLANLVVDKGLSCIIDVSQFESDSEKARFAKDFANRLFFRKKAAPSALHLFLEECQEFVPQNPYKGEEQMLHAFIRMQKLGRNFGIGSSYITQRPQEVNKKALNMAQTLFVFRTTGTHERTAIEKWMEDKSLDQDIASDLPKLATGTCHVWSPEFLKISEIIKISEKDTFNASATPEVGAVAKARHLAPIDLVKVRSEMAATIEKTKAEDPKELKKKIRELEKQINSERGVVRVKPADPKEMEKRVKEEAQKILAIRENYYRQFHVDIVRDTEAIKKNAERIIADINKQMKQKVAPVYRSSYALKGTTISQPEFNVVKNNPVFSKAALKEIPHETKESKITHSMKTDYFDVDGNEIKSLSKGAKAVLSYLKAVAPAEKSKTQLWVATGYSPGGGFNNLIYELTGRELIVQTPKGYKAAYENYDSSMIDEFYPSLDLWKNKLGLGAKKVFEVLLRDPDTARTKEELAGETGYALGGGFNNNIYELTGAELVKKQGTAYIINPEILDL